MCLKNATVKNILENNQNSIPFFSFFDIHRMKIEKRKVINQGKLFYSLLSFYNKILSKSWQINRNLILRSKIGIRNFIGSQNSQKFQNFMNEKSNISIKCISIITYLDFENFKISLFFNRDEFCPSSIEETDTKWNVHRERFRLKWKNLLN